MKVISKVLCFVFFGLICLSTHEVWAQKQLVLLRGETIKLRLHPGDDFIYKLKNSHGIKTSYVNNIFETAVYTHHDTVPFHTIDRVYYQHSTFSNRVGSLFLAGGIALFLIDQINNSLVHGNKLSFDRGVSLASVSLITVGLPMVLIRKKSQRLGFPYRLMMVKKGSPFYKEDAQGYSSPYLPD